jgi:signal transduction histidine kinase
MRQQTAEANPGNAQSHPTPEFFPRKARAQVLGRLIAGFIVIIALLGLDGLVGFFGATSVRASLASLTRQQAVSLAFIDALQRAQSAVSVIQYRLPTVSSAAERAELKDALARAESRLGELFARVPPDASDTQIWHELESASTSLTAHLSQALALPPGKKLDVVKLLDERERLTLATQRLMRSSHERIDATRLQIEDITWRQSIEDRVLLAACLLVASLFLVTSTRIYYRMSEQSEELNRVSWQLLERQELLAQRLSRELHDELGQSLTALKTNFSRHASSGCVDLSWMRDCTELLKGSIRSAHEISQLLRPTLLDDFGLDSALSWLCERFEERNGIQVRYQSDFHWRLEEQEETHVFRIAQEALTNVARHAKATAVDVFFSKRYGIVRLKISDNGVGLKSRSSGALPSFGLTGMKARARSLEGEMHIESSPGQGVAIEVVFPAKHAS